MVVMRVLRPKKGQKIYIPSSFYIGHGEDDVQGGLATIAKVIINEKLQITHVNSVFVEVVEVPCRQYNYQYLIGEQEYLKNKYGDRIAYPDPDIK